MDPNYATYPQAQAGVYAPAPAPHYYVKRPTNAWAIASLVLGIFWLYWIGSILAVIFGFIALREIKNSQGAEEGKGLAIAGLVLGCVWLGWLLIGLGASLIDLPS